MNTYYVYLRRGGTVRVTAAGYTESKRSQRVYFYTDPARKDRQTWFNLRDLEGIHVAEVLSFESVPPNEAYRAWLAETLGSAVPKPEDHSIDAATAT